MNKYELHEYHKQHTQQIKGSVFSKMLPIFVWRNEFISSFLFISIPSKDLQNKNLEVFYYGINQRGATTNQKSTAVLYVEVSVKRSTGLHQQACNDTFVRIVEKHF